MTEGTLSVALAEPVTTAPEGETSWVEILREGTYKHDIYGEIQITRASLEQMVKNFEAGVRGIEIAIDVAHDPDRGAAGWIKRLEIRPSSRDEGKVSLWGEVTWTSFGRELVEGGVYRYISAEFGPWTDPESGEKYEDVLFAATLTNRPFVKGMAPVSLSEVVSLARKLWEGLRSVFGEDKGELQMAVKTENGKEYPASAYLYVPDPDKPSTWKLRIKEYVNGRLQVTRAQLGRAAAAFSPGGFRGRRVSLPPGEVSKVKAKLRALYRKIGVPDDQIPSYIKAEEVIVDDRLLDLISSLGIELAEDADPIEALKSHIEGLKAKIAELEEKFNEPAEMEEAAKALKLAEAKNKELEERVQRLEKELREREKAVYFDEKVREGKLTPAERPYFEELYDKDADTVKKLLDERDVVVDFSEKGTDSDKGESSLSPQDKLDRLARKLMEEKEISYEEALLQVAADNPDLAV